MIARREGCIWAGIKGWWLGMGLQPVPRTSATWWGCGRSTLSQGFKQVLKGVGLLVLSNRSLCYFLLQFLCISLCIIPLDCKMCYLIVNYLINGQKLKSCFEECKAGFPTDLFFLFRKQTENFCDLQTLNLSRLKWEMGKVWIFLRAWAAQSSQAVFVSAGDFLNEKFRYRGLIHLRTVAHHKFSWACSPRWTLWACPCSG